MIPMGKAFVATLGFEPSAILRLVGEKGISSDDVIYLITSKTPHPRVENAIKSVKDFVDKISPKAFVEVLRLDENSLEENIATLAKLLKTMEEPIVDITGGPKGLSIALYLAAGFANIGKVYITTETTGERLEIPTIQPPTHTLTPKQVEILKQLPNKLTKIAENTKTSKSTISKQLKGLINKGLAYKENKTFHPTLQGKITLKLIEHK
ncbi:MAG: hypothetical protein B7O98_09695 [Zestosphaera tikiterensis]|uniref:Uncharacterized protein n=1 Tax=Zestosphaera tikiterensis TaxID=1973259 RepID=A0A2R7Y149_9CREN|nr:MAG: hypothetical protein B7O98_09695 [Zestosphaera tikiterensis]